MSTSRIRWLITIFIAVVVQLVLEVTAGGSRHEVADFVLGVPAHRAGEDERTGGIELQRGLGHGPKHTPQLGLAFQCASDQPFR